jgi:hypothetical protein
MRLHERKHAEIREVWNHLRKTRNHTSDFCLAFISQNYFIGVDHVYNIIRNEDSQPFEADKASIIYHQVKSNEYFSLYSNK